MTIEETYALIATRIGWKDDKTVKGFTPSTLNQTTDSGLFFQDEHSAITLTNIHSCQPRAEISNEDFEIYLDDLRKATVRQVLKDVFSRDYVNDKLLDVYPTAFDDLISLKMTIKISELIMTAIRSNRTKRYDAQFVGKLNYDVFREAPNKFAIRGANYIQSLGISTRYDYFLAKTQRRFGDEAIRLKTITKGQVSNELYPDRYSRH